MIEYVYVLIIGFLLAASLNGFVFTFLYLKSSYSSKDSQKVNDRKISKYFILFTILFVLVVGGATIYLITNTVTKEFLNNSKVDYIVKFKNAGTLNESSDVIYRGVKVGKVGKTSITPDAQYALVSLNITEKNLKLYEGVKATKESKNFMGNDSLVLTPEEKNTQLNPIKKGTIINGIEADPSKDMNKILNNFVETGKFKYMLDNISKTSGNVENITANLLESSERNKPELNKLLRNANSLTANLNNLSSGMNSFVNDSENKKNLKSTLLSASNAASNSNDLIVKTSALMEQTNDVLGNVNQTVGNTELRQNIIESFSNLKGVLSNANELSSDKEVKQSFKGIMKNMDKSLQSIDCFSKSISKVLSSRFLIPKMIIGVSDKSFKICLPEETDKLPDKLPLEK